MFKSVLTYDYHRLTGELRKTSTESQLFSNVNILNFQKSQAIKAGLFVSDTIKWQAHFFFSSKNLEVKQIT